jgi:hypothetical protein
MLDRLLTQRNLRDDLASGFVVLTGLDEQPFPGTWKRYQEMKPDEEDHRGSA